MFLLAVENFVKLISVGIVCHSLIFFTSIQRLSQDFPYFSHSSFTFLFHILLIMWFLLFFDGIVFVLLTDYLALQITQNK